MKQKCVLKADYISELKQRAEEVQQGDDSAQLVKAEPAAAPVKPAKKRPRPVSGAEAGVKHEQQRPQLASLLAAATAVANTAAAQSDARPAPPQQASRPCAL